MPAYLEGNPCMYEYLYLLIVSKSLALQVKNKTSLRDAFTKFGWSVIMVIGTHIPLKVISKKSHYFVIMYLA